MKKSTTAIVAIIAILLILQVFPLKVYASETAVYSEGFESSDGGYTHAGTLDQWQWGTPTNPNGPGSAHSGLNCWATNLAGDVPENSQSYLTSQPIGLPSITSNQLLRVRFYAWIAVDEMYDRGEFQASSDGASWVTLAELFNRMQGNWSTYDFDVSNYAGGQIYLRFHLSADNIEAFEQSSPNMAGLYIDDVKITVFDAPASKTALTLEAQEDQSTSSSCPWVFSWTSSGFTQDNDIYSTAQGPDKEYIDYYKLNTSPVPVGNNYMIDLRELTHETSYTDFVKLIAIDHQATTKVASDENGNLWTYSNPIAPFSAIDGDRNNVLNQLAMEDGVAFKGFDGDSVTLDFSNVDVKNGATLVLNAAGFKNDGDPGAPTGVSPRIFVQTQDASGNWISNNCFYPRNEFATAAFDLTRYLTANKLVRLYVTSCLTGKYHLVDYVALDNNTQADLVVHSLSPSSAIHSTNGDVLSKVANSDNQYASMDVGETLSLSFTVPVMESEVRDFVLQTEGYYIPSGTYFISTWDGSSWVERDGWSILGSGDQRHNFDMSPFLPDTNGQFKVRIWQDFWYEPAGIDYVGLTHADTNATMTSAFDLRKNIDVTNFLNSSDNISDDWGWTSSDPTGYPNSRARNRWVEVTFNLLGQQNFPPTTNPVIVTNLTSNTPTISWTYADQDSDPQTMCEVEVWSASGGSGSNMWDPAAITGPVTSIVYAGLSLNIGQIYYARVKAFDGKDWGQWSETTFTLRNPYSVSIFPPAINGLKLDLNGVASPSSLVDSIVFDWGDGGQTSGGFPISHTYASSGNYTIIVTANYNDESTASTSANVSVYPGALTGGNSLIIRAGSDGSVAYISSVGSGTISPGNSSTLYLAYADYLSLSATPNGGCNFVSWTGSSGITGLGGSPINTATPNITIVVNSDSSIVANFSVNYSLTMFVVGQGQVSPGNGTFSSDSVVPITAANAVGWRFQGWSGDASGSANMTITMNSNKTVTATFVQNTYTIVVTVVGQGLVSRNATGPYTYGQVVSLTATPQAGWSFSNWAYGSYRGSANPTTLVVTGDVTMTATFIINPPPPPPVYSLSVSSGVGGSTNPVPGFYSELSGSNIQVMAIPDFGYAFSYWLLDGMNVGSTIPIVVTMNGDHWLQAFFVQVTYSLSVSSGVGGSISPNAGSYFEVSGSNVQVTATPSLGYAFSYWLLDGNNVGNANPIMVTMDGDHSLQAVFNSTLNSPSASASASTIDQGQSSTLAVTGLSGGATPYSYQWLWRVPGAGIYSTISGATSATYLFLAFPSTVPGAYYFVLRVTDSVGEQVTSSAASVQVNVRPTVTISPTSITMDVGQSNMFTASASGGTGTLTYQWYLDGSAISGATNSTWTFTPLSAGSPSLYVRITDQASLPIMIQSNTPAVTVNPAPSVTVSPSPWTMNNGQSKTFTASASGGTGTLTYQWYLNGSAIPGQTSPTYNFTASSQGSPTIYVMVTDRASPPLTVSSNTPNVTVNSALIAPTASASPSIIEQGQSIALSANEISGGTNPYSYQWFRRAPAAGNYSLISGATTISYGLSTSTSTATGSWFFMLQVTDATGATVNSIEVMVTVTATTTVNSALVAPGVHASVGTIDQSQSSSLTCDSVSTGLAPYSYQWLEKAPASASYLAISGASSAVYTFSTSISTAIGSYSFKLRVTDAHGVVVTSNAVIIIVHSLPSIAISPTTVALDIGQSKSFSSIVAGGTSPFSYQWYLNGSSVSGATDSTYTYTLSTNGTSVISVRVTDKYGVTATSDNASVTVYAKLATPTVRASSTIIDQGQSVNLTASPVSSIENVKNTQSRSNQLRYSAVASITTTEDTPTYTVQWLEKSPGHDFFSPISGATSLSYTFATTSSTAIGTWSFELQVTDKAGVVATSSPITIVVNPQLSAPSASASTATGNPASVVNQGEACLLTAAEVSSGTSPYSYQWFMKAPNINSYSLIMGAATPTYDFATTASTMAGTWTFLLQVTDSAGATVNSTEITLVINTVKSANSTRLSETNPSVWVPSAPNAIESSIVTIAAVSVVSAVVSSAMVGGSAAGGGGGLIERLKELLPESVKKWLEDFISSKRKRSITAKKGPTLMPTKPELLAYAIAIVILTVCFAYVKAPSLSEMLQIIPIILATSILVEIVKSYAVTMYARKQGIWTEHKLWYTGLAMLLITAFAFRMPFSKPSRNEHHSSKITEKIEGYISSVEVVIALWFATFFFILLLAGFTLIGGTGLAMCVTMAFCDTFPIAPMNGKNIFKHSKGIWAGLFTLTLVLFVLWIMLL